MGQQGRLRERDQRAERRARREAGKKDQSRAPWDADQCAAAPAGCSRIAASFACATA
jgi:hypothetical protein